MKELNHFTRRFTIICFGLALASCGGGGGGDESDTYSSEISVVPHDPASLLLTGDNIRFAMANAQAIQHVFRFWIDQARRTVRYVDPEKTSYGYLCGGGGQVDITYSDVDRNNRVSRGDQIISNSPVCGISPLGGGRTTFTVMGTNSLGIADARVRADGTVEDFAYGWAHKLTGTVRFLYSDSNTILVLSEGDIELALYSGQLLKLRNIAVTYKISADSSSGQFDLIFSTGREAGMSVQVDTDGDIHEGGSNVGPAPGALLLSGLNGTKARLEGRYVVGIGERFRILTNLNGNSQLAELADVDDQEFYSWFKQ